MIESKLLSESEFSDESISKFYDCVLLIDRFHCDLKYFECFVNVIKNDNSIKILLGEDFSSIIREIEKIKDKIIKTDYPQKWLKNFSPSNGTLLLQTADEKNLDKVNAMNQNPGESTP